MSDATVSLTPKDLEKIIAGAVKAAVEEAKKPYVSDADKARMTQEQADRKQQAQLVKDEANNRFRRQQICTHFRSGGTTRAVFVKDERGGYMICQKCQAVVRPDQAPDGYSGHEHYNVDLFNRLFQAANRTND